MDADGVDVKAEDAPVLVVPAVAPLGLVVHGVGLAAGARGDEVGPGAGPHDLVSARLDERQGTKFAGVGAGNGRYTGDVHSVLSLLWAGLREAATSPGPFSFDAYILTLSPRFCNIFGDYWHALVDDSDA